MWSTLLGSAVFAGVSLALWHHAQKTNTTLAPPPREATREQQSTTIVLPGQPVLVLPTPAPPPVVSTTPPVVPEPATWPSALNPEVVEVVQEHNAIRSQFGLDPLVWDEELARDALRYARILQDWNAGNPGRPVHPGQPTLHEVDNPHGENIYWRRATHDSTSMAHAVRQWAGEAADYNYSTNECSGICGHYTQIVWRNTRKVGCAKVQFGDQTFVVCKYDPPGNIVGRKPY